MARLLRALVGRAATEATKRVRAQVAFAVDLAAEDELEGFRVQTADDADEGTLLGGFATWGFVVFFPEVLQGVHGVRVTIPPALVKHEIADPIVLELVRPSGIAGQSQPTHQWNFGYDPVVFVSEPDDVLSELVRVWTILMGLRDAPRTPPRL